MKYLIPFLYVVCMVSACIKPPQYSNTPEIRFERLSKNLVLQNGQDSFQVVFSFKDGDGDLGLPTDQTGQDVFLTDSRTGNFIGTPFRMPYITEAGSVSGEVYLTVYAPCCIYWDGFDTTACYTNPADPRDTVIYTITIRDRAGHVSNAIQTDPVILKCD